MKSIQFNYFASGGDLRLIAEAILDWEPDLIIFQPRGSHFPLHGTHVHDPSWLIPKSPNEMHLLCPAACEHSVQTTRIDEQTSCIRTQENPVIEYSPSMQIDAETVKIGRLYANYNDLAFIERVETLFRTLQRQSVLLDKSGLWIFPDAAREKRVLKMWAGKDWENPYRARAHSNASRVKHS